MARHTWFPKLGLKPGWLKRQSKFLPLSHEETNSSEGNLNSYVSHLFCFYKHRLNGDREFNSYEEPCFTLVTTIYLSRKRAQPLKGRGAYIYLSSYQQIRCLINGPEDLGSIPGRVIPKTQKMVLDASLLNTQHYKVRIKGKVKQSREGVAPSPTPWCSSYWKGSLRVTLDYGRQLTIYEDETTD